MQPITFATLVSPADLTHFQETVPHLVRACGVSFYEVVIVADDLPKGGRSPHLTQELRDSLGRLSSTIPRSRCVWLSQVDACALAERHFGCRVSKARDHRGVPLLGWIAAIEASQTDLVAYFDSDIVLHGSWLEAAASLLRADASVMFVAPRPGPPTPDGSLRGHDIPPIIDQMGHFRWKTFSSRRFLVSKARYSQMLPVKPRFISTKRRVAQAVGVGNAMLPWEVCVSSALAASPYFRVHLSARNAWSIHCGDRSPTFVGALPHIIRMVERGESPERQAGHYELILPAWIDMIKS